MNYKKGQQFSDKERDRLTNFFRTYSLSPAQIAVITAILFNAVAVHSVLVDRDQKVVILLEGFLNNPSNNNNMDKLLNEISHMNVGELMGIIGKKK